MLKEMRDVKSILIFPKPHDVVKSVLTVSFSDVDFYICSRRYYGLVSIMAAMELFSRNGKRLYHIISLTSSKQQRVRFCSHRAYIFSWTVADDRGCNRNMSLKSITWESSGTPHVLKVYSTFMHDTITTMTKDSRVDWSKQVIWTKTRSHSGTSITLGAFCRDTVT